MADKSNQRLQAVLNALHPPPSSLRKRIIVLPDDSKVDISPATIPSDPYEAPTVIAIDGTAICSFKILPRSIKLVISSIGTPHENSADHVPEFPVLKLLPPSVIDPNRGHSESRISIGDVWAAIYTLNTIYHTQETIPIQFSSSFTNIEEITSYIIDSGLGRRRHVQQGVPSDSDVYLSREAFWQGAGTLGFHTRGWLRTRRALQGAAPFPRIPSFTRSPLVITSHPLRPPKPKPGECVYRRFCPSIGQTLEFTFVDPSDRPNGEISPHLAAFHKWHNDERVNKGWGEAGPIEKHRKYLCDLMRDPGVLPMMMSWDGELMGYTEITWIKESHVAGYIPDGVGEYDQGLHVLVGEDKFRGSKNLGPERSKAWFTSILHYIFISEPRTQRVVGEPKANNPAIIKLSEDCGMTINTLFDLPYKRSVMTWLPREKFFRLDLLSKDPPEA